LLHELLPTAKVMALLVNPADRALAQALAREVLSAARNRKLELHPRRYDFKKLQRGVFGLFFPHRHGAQAIFLQREFSQRFKCARSVDAAFCTETGRKNYPIIYFCIVGKAQPVSRRTAFPAAIDGIATLGLEQLATPATSPFAHRLGRRLP
jgi:hypothetical protein